MADLLIRNASQILTCKVAGEHPPYAGRNQNELGIVEGAVAIEGGEIAAVGPAAEGMEAERVLDAQGGVVLPGFVDPHTHAVFVGSRADEFESRIRGISYEEIARRGGGIQSSMRALRRATDAELAEAVRRHLDGFLDLGTTTIEGKSGYGLTKKDELRSLRALGTEHPVDVVRTCLAAHTVPAEFESDREGYIRLVVEEILPAVAKERLARYCDVFCEQGVFNFEESERILDAGSELRLQPKVHADQLTRSGGARVACRVGAASADHLEYATQDDAVAMRKAKVMAVLLPAANHVLDQERRPPARTMIGVSLPVALATDFNPGTAPTQSMPMVIHLGVVLFKMTVAEAIVASTINAACAIGEGARVGSLEVGKQADVVVLDMEDYRDLAYRFGTNPVRAVVKRGKVVRG